MGGRAAGRFFAGVREPPGKGLADRRKGTQVHQAGPGDSRRGSRRVRPVRLAVAAMAVGALSIQTMPAAMASGQPTATAQPAASGHHAFPSQAQVDAAKQDAAQKAKDVGAIKAQLLLAKQRLRAGRHPRRAGL